MADETLKALEERARAKQAAFIGNIAKRLGRAEPQKERPAHPFKGAPDFWNAFDLPPEERISLFMENWRKAGGHAVRTADMDEAKAWIADKVRELSAKRILRQRQEELDAMRLEEALPDAEVAVWDDLPPDGRLAAAAGADIGVFVADRAVAYTGSLMVMSSAEKGRSVSLLPAAFFAVVPADRIVTRLGEALRPLDETPRERLPAGVHFISGPSRSADIENDLTIGVHGPGVVFAIVVG